MKVKFLNLNHFFDCDIISLYPQSPIPNPQSPIPNPQFSKLLKKLKNY